MRSSSARPWPETCTGALSSCSTSAPDRARRLIASWTRSSFPGIGFAEMITVSPASTVTCGMVVVRDARHRRHRLALAAGAEDQLLARAAAPRVASGAGSRRPERSCSRGCARCSSSSSSSGRRTRPCGRTRCRRRPPAACGARSTRTTRRGSGPCGSGRSGRNASPTTFSDCVTPGALGVRRVAEQEVDAAVADLGELADVGALAVDRRVVDLVVARVHDPAARRLEHDGGGIRDRVRHADELDPERPEIERLVAGRDLAQLGIAQQAVLVELRLDEPERQPRRDDRPGSCTSRIRYGSEPTWSSWPCVSTTPRIIDSRSRRYVKSGRTRSTPRCSSRGNASPASTMTIESVRLVGGHVLPDLAETAERDDVADAHLRPQCSSVRCARFTGETVGDVSGSSMPARSRHAAELRRALSVGSTIGRR